MIFEPSTRTRGQYQDVARFGIEPGAKMRIAEIRDGVYLYDESGAGGWPWTDFTALEGEGA